MAKWILVVHGDWERDALEKHREEIRWRSRERWGGEATRTVKRKFLTKIQLFSFGSLVILSAVDFSCKKSNNK
jgi:hypothetical protein